MIGESRMNQVDRNAHSPTGLMHSFAACTCFAQIILFSPAAPFRAAEPAPKAQRQEQAGKRPAEPVAKPAARDPQQEQRQQQIEQQAKHFEQFIRPVLEAELELVRRTCGSLSPAARRQVLAAGNESVRVAARDFAAWQFGNRRPGQADKSDPQRSVQETVFAAVKPHATPEELAAYERERADRLARRDRATRLSIVAKIDQELQLSIPQRSAIAADLEKGWKPDWTIELGDRGHRINGRRPAPDFVDHCISPHLDERQRTAWKAWCQKAGWNLMRQGFVHFSADGQGLEPDPWWTP